jgi:hypothetical protein
VIDEVDRRQTKAELANRLFALDPPLVGDFDHRLNKAFLSRWDEWRCPYCFLEVLNSRHLVGNSTPV